MADVKRPRPHDHDTLQLVNILKTIRQSIQKGAPVEQLKAKLPVLNRGSIERIFALLKKLPEGRELLSEQVQGNQELARRMDDLAIEQLRSIAAQLADIDRWRALAAKDRDQYRRKLDEVLSASKTLLNRLCGIESHRHAENAERDKIIHEIKSSKPHLSFGRVALEYKRRTGKQITGKLAERSYTRYDARFQAEMKDMLLMLFGFDVMMAPFIEQTSHILGDPPKST